MKELERNIIRVEPASQAPDRLFILLHGVGANAAGLRPLGVALQGAFPASAAVLADGTEPFDGGGAGRQWFSVRGITEGNRPARVAQALPALEDFVRAEQAHYGVLPENTVLGGFSQGTIMSLALAVARDGLAGRVLAFSGRFAVLPDAAPMRTAIHFLHGGRDPVIAVRHAIDAQARLGKLGGAVTLDIDQDAGHELSAALLDAAVRRLGAPARG